MTGNNQFKYSQGCRQNFFPGRENLWGPTPPSAVAYEFSASFLVRQGSHQAQSKAAGLFAKKFCIVVNNGYEGG